MTHGKKKEIALLFSGGTDSTLSAAIVASEFEKINLLTYSWKGLHSTTNTALNLAKLKEKYPRTEFEHHIINIDKLMKYVFYDNYLYYWRKFGFFLLSICGLCKLAMHIRTMFFCIDNAIEYACDGANKGMYLFPAQMLPVIKEYKRLYLEIGIEYFNPVYDYDGPQNLEFRDRLHLGRMETSSDQEDTKPDLKTTGDRLFELGIIPERNVKGTSYDRKMQPRCFQFILYNIFLHWYYLPGHSYDEFVNRSLEFNMDKINKMGDQLKLYKDGKKNRLAGYIQ